MSFQKRDDHVLSHLGLFVGKCKIHSVPNFHCTGYLYFCSCTQTFIIMPKGKITKPQDDPEFDELEESEEDYEYDEEEDQGFYIKAALKPPNSHPVSCYDLYNQIQEGGLSSYYLLANTQWTRTYNVCFLPVDADYQRDVVWNDAKQSNLIDSVYRDYFIPPVLFAKRIGDDGEEIKVCIDGKQRLTSIHRFMDGHWLNHFSPWASGKSWFYQTRGNKAAKKVIPNGWKKQFASKQLIVVEFADLSDERDIFQRVQLGMALNEAEKQKAISSPTVTWIRTMVTQYFEVACFGCYVFGSHKILEYVYMASALPAFDSPGTVKLTRFLGQQDERSDAFKKPVERAIRDLHKLVQDETNLKLTGAAAVAPGRSLRTMAGAIGKMRTVIRGKHIDVRANTRVAKSFAEHLETLQAPGISGPETDWQIDTSAARAAKKRKADDDDDTDMAFTSDDGFPNGSASKGKAKLKPRPSAKNLRLYLLAMFAARNVLRVPLRSPTLRRPIHSGVRGDWNRSLAGTIGFVAATTAGAIVDPEVRRPPPTKSASESNSKPSASKAENTSVDNQASVKSSPSEPGIIEPSSDAPTPQKDGENVPEGGMDGLEADAANQGAFNPETGEINWDCPCLGGMAHGPCGPEFREAFSCFVYSKEDPKGVDCVEKFKAMQDCFREHPDVYGEGALEGWYQTKECIYSYIHVQSLKMTTKHLMQPKNPRPKVARRAQPQATKRTPSLSRVRMRLLLLTRLPSREPELRPLMSLTERPLRKALPSTKLDVR
ncbi:CHCH domain-containing protein [Rhizoctonia solani AG-1 IA]|uniref:Mitochondrial intermembrane space import and assembly protein 40 n=1 Tax=Thanatephorus cucumeris (strain AG1-IA) TaxID=983506 RepID=L8WMX9_THACA|nr:CHCH domain-containing protein [Rhizoctonia solani AG-1 IA]